jgi:hypothetical protein
MLNRETHDVWVELAHRSRAWPISLYRGTKRYVQVIEYMYRDYTEIYSLTMCAGNDSNVQVVDLGMLSLHLPSRLILNLNNCYFMPMLSKSGNNCCSIYMNNISMHLL